MNDRQKRIIELADSVTDKVLAYLIGMPPPWTFIVTVGALVGAFVAGLML